MTCANRSMVSTQADSVPRQSRNSLVQGTRLRADSIMDSLGANDCRNASQ